MEDKKKQGASQDVLYICNRKKCECCYPECHHTKDIHYAANFVRVFDLGYMEVEKNDTEKNSRKN